VSLKYYEDTVYGNALLLYNKENPTGNGSIRVPPIEVLNKRFPNYVPKVSTRTTIQPTSGTIPVTTPPIETGMEFQNPLKNFPVYTVKGDGETLQEIAERTLGNPGYWKAIKELNPAINEKERIPSGTQMYLPPQARVIP